jgi:hypothetical protein
VRCEIVDNEGGDTEKEASEMSDRITTSQLLDRIRYLETENRRLKNKLGKASARTRVIIESPFGRRQDGQPCTQNEMAKNIEYARKCMHESLERGEAPYGSHLLYPQVYDDATPEERRGGMESGFAWGEVAELIAVYIDRGLTDGMREGINRHQSSGIEIEYRKLGMNGWSSP